LAFWIVEYDEATLSELVLTRQHGGVKCDRVRREAGWRRKLVNHELGAKLYSRQTDERLSKGRRQVGRCRQIHRHAPTVGAVLARAAATRAGAGTGCNIG
jgi:hypothetical protein